MSKKRYTENDEIELRLTHYVSDCYILEWRFKEPRKWWFFKKHDKWRRIEYYQPGIFVPSDNPDDSSMWFWRSFHLGKKSEVQEYERLKERVKTKKDLYSYFKVKENMGRYYNHLDEHRKWVDEYNATIDRLTK